MIGLLFVAGIIWLGVKLLIWVFNSLIGVLDPATAEKVRRWTRFGIAVFLILAILSGGGT